jgi:hypothetical protein
MHSVDGEVSALWFFTIILNEKCSQSSQSLARYSLRDHGERAYTIGALHLGVCKIVAA